MQPRSCRFYACHRRNPRSNFPLLKTHFIVNLRSGAAARALPHVQAFAREQGATLGITQHTRHAFALATDALAAGCELVVAVGGDGTMNEVATALVDTSATLGLIPCGSGDGLGRHLRIHGSPQHALAVLRAGNVRVIDTGLADGHPFFCVAGVGFEAQIAHRFNGLKRRGFARYLTTSAIGYWRSKPEDYVVTHDGRTERIRAFTLAITNADQYGNNARIAPGARIDDGLLNLCAVPPLHLFNAAPLALQLFTGRLDRAARVVSRHAARFVVERAAPGLLHTDGEIHSAGTRIEFTIRPSTLRVMAPAPR